MFTTQLEQGERKPGVPSVKDAGRPAAADASAHIVLVGGNPASLPQLAALLEQQGHRVSQARDAAHVLSVLRDDPPELVVVDGSAGTSADALSLAVGARALPWLVVLDAPPDPNAWDHKHAVASDWVLRPNLSAELPARAGSLLKRTRSSAGGPPRLPADGRFLSLVVHDLRTPLNVIGLSLRMITQSVPKGDPDLDEDLRFVEENFKQIERMLAQLSDYFRLFDGAEPLYITEFSPQTLLGELLENRAAKHGTKGATVRLDVHGTCPRAVALDQGRARLAIQHALSNAVAAAGDGTVVVMLRGEPPERWIIEISTDRPAPASVQPVELRSEAFERLCGTAAERRGMDLAIAARVTELFQGRARLDVRPHGTSLIFDWPERLPDGAA